MLVKRTLQRTLKNLVVVEKTETETSFEAERVLTVVSDPIVLVVVVWWDEDGIRVQVALKTPLHSLLREGLPLSKRFYCDVDAAAEWLREIDRGY